ncbi:MAG: Gfo/Idh/MocA family protein [Steroidobacteraceae bacterium]
MKVLGMGLVGPGFIAVHHIDAVRRLGDVEVLAIAASNQDSADRKARELKVPRAYGSYQDLIADRDVHVVHNTTPNHLHFEVSRAALKAGKHVISDKPLGMAPAECRLLRDAALSAGLAHVVTFNYRGNPLIQQARRMIAAGEIGPASFIHGHYFQDWLTDPNVYSWRSDPAKGGLSSALADIGSHWCDLAEHVSQSRIKAVLAELTTVVRVRHSSARSTEAFAADHGAKFERIEMQSEDLASVLLRFENDVKGCFSVGQVLPGHKNDLQLEVNGAAASIRWRQEQQNELWVGRYAQANLELTKDPATLHSEAKRFVHLPAGHQQGWADAFRNVIADAYDWIRRGATPEAKPDATATFADGYRSSCVIDAMLRSHAAGGVWQLVECASE